MIYVDVTGGCQLALQSGIPRTTRELYRLVQDRARGTKGIRWQPFRFAYTELSPRAAALLQNPFGERSLRHRPPRDTTLPLLQAALRDLAAWPRAVPLRRWLRPEDTLLLASLFPDNRLGALARVVAGPGRTIAIFHDAIPLRDPNVRPWEKRLHLRALRLLAQMHTVVAVSEAAREDLHRLWREYAIEPAVTTVLRWPVPFTLARPPFSPPPSIEKNILYVSRLKQVKNHAALLEACDRLWREGLRFSLSLVGCEDEARESEAILARVGALAAAGRPISWRAQISDYELHAAYRHCSFTVFPSRHEGFGLPIVESFWHGRAVICSGHDAMGEISSGGGARQVEVADPSALAAAMRALLSDDAANLALAREAYARPVRTWDDYWEELAPLLDRSP